MEETLDGALGGRVKVVQPKKGYRFSLDAILLAQFAKNWPANKACDFCSGSGVVGLCLLELGAANEVTGYELQDGFVDMANRSATLNGFGGRAMFVKADLSRFEEFVPGGGAQLVVANPPYRRVGLGHLPKDPNVALARHEISLNLQMLLSAASFALSDGGVFCVVFPAEEIDRLYKEFSQSDLTLEVRWRAHPREGEKESLVFLMARKGALRGEIMELAPLVLHGEPGKKYSAEASKLLGQP